MTEVPGYRIRERMNEFNVFVCVCVCVCVCVNVESAGGDGQHRGGGQPGAGPSRGVPDARRRGAAAAQPDPSGPRRDDRLAFVAVLPRGRQC